MFPLYDKLAQQSREINFNPSIICSTINTLNKEHAEIIYSIILHHAVLCGIDVRDAIPYEIKLLPVGKGLTVKLEKLPIELQKILYCYIISKQSK
jgi:cysteine sulfinate desulfinase/cysteine desulfurase-like protein